MSTNELKILFPDEDLTLMGEPTIVKPFPFGKIPKVITQASMIVQMMVSMPEELITEEGNLDLEDPATSIILATMMEQCGKPVMEILALSVNKPREWVEDLPPDEGILLLAKVWEVNKDFFMRRLAPMLQKLKKVNLKPTSPATTSSLGEQSSVN